MIPCRPRWFSPARPGCVGLGQEWGIAVNLELFLFTSKNVTNIWAGIGAGRWAVSETSDMQSRITKSRRMRVGSLGLLYCSENQCFTTPFIVYSEADPKEVVADVWPEKWRLPFRIHPLGNPTRLISIDEAKKRWPVLQGCNNITERLNIGGTVVFVPSTISQEDWELILKELAV